MTFKLAVRTVAKRHGLHATFMPKPNFGMKGSALFYNMFLCKNGVNVFSDPDARIRTQQRSLLFHGWDYETYQRNDADR